MVRANVTDSGRLEEKYLPAIYFDSSVLIDWWITEGLELEGEEDEDIEEEKDIVLLREILNADKRLEKLVEIRKKVILETPKLNPVISPLCLLELMEWEAESKFKQIASQATSVQFMQRKSRKEIGIHLKTIHQKWLEERESFRGDSGRTAIEALIREFFINSSFAHAHGFDGLLTVDVKDFELTFVMSWKNLAILSYLQLGAADILHILMAQHFGCEFFGSFDSDFKRAKDAILKNTGIHVLSSPEEILSVL